MDILVASRLRDTESLSSLLEEYIRSVTSLEGFDVAREKEMLEAEIMRVVSVEGKPLDQVTEEVEGLNDHINELLDEASTLKSEIETLKKELEDGAQ